MWFEKDFQVTDPSLPPVIPSSSAGHMPTPGPLLAQNSSSLSSLLDSRISGTPHMELPGSFNLCSTMNPGSQESSSKSDLLDKEKQLYDMKVMQLSIYIEPLQKMISKMQSNVDITKKDRNLAKLKRLLSVLEKKEKAPYQALLKVEDVLRRKLHGVPNSTQFSSSLLNSKISGMSQVELLRSSNPSSNANLGFQETPGKNDMSGKKDQIFVEKKLQTHKVKVRSLRDYRYISPFSSSLLTPKTSGISNVELPGSSNPSSNVNLGSQESPGKNDVSAKEKQMFVEKNSTQLSSSLLNSNISGISHVELPGSSNPSSNVNLGSGKNDMSAKEEQKYAEKLAQMSVYIEPLQKIMVNAQNIGDPNLTKLKRLQAILRGEARVPYQNLLNLEDVLRRKLQENPRKSLDNGLPMKRPINIAHAGNTKKQRVLGNTINLENVDVKAKHCTLMVMNLPYDSMTVVHDKEVKMTLGNRIKIVVGDLAQEKVDVIVNTTNDKVDLNASRCGKALLNAAGEELLNECQKIGNLPVGDMVSTGSAKLNCKRVYHIRLTSWQNSGGALILRLLIRKCLDQMKQDKLRSIAIPAVGTGALHFPHTEVAKILFEEVTGYLTDRSELAIDEVHFVAFDQATVDVFLDAVQEIKSIVSLPTRNLVSAPVANTGLKPPVGRKFHKFNLSTCSKEYTDIETVFHKSVPKVAVRIVRIEKIENKEIYELYNVKRNAMMKKFGTNFAGKEQWLFHGTSLENIDKINANGLNRSYAGAHGRAYGKGVYFAKDANYSCRPTFSPPDWQGLRYVYYAKVLVGDSTLGNSTMIARPSKNTADPHETYESVVDNISQPNIYVLFQDYEYYTEYLITFIQIAK